MMLSVILCTHNPRMDYLQRAVDALREQTLGLDQWEFLLIDNNSSLSIPLAVDLSWHPAGRHLSEEKLSLTPARLRGIAEARGHYLLFVDDDNVLTRDYLRNF